MSLIRVPLLCSFSILLLLACKKDNLPDPANGTHLTRVVVTTGDSLAFLSFQYDAANRLIAIIDSNNNNIGNRGITTIRYDNQNRPVKSERIYYFKAGNTLPYGSDSLAYDNDRVVKKFYLPYNGSINDYKLVQKFVYNTTGDLVSDSGVGSNGQVGSWRKYTLDEHANITQWQVVSSDGYNTTTSAVYDKEAGMYGDWGKSLLFYLWNDPLLLNKNAIKEIHYANGTTQFYSNIYNGAGLTTNTAIQVGTNAAYSRMEFFYE